MHSSPLRLCATFQQMRIIITRLLCADGPAARRGHSLLLYNKSKVIVFGGLANREMALHTPKTFEIKQVRLLSNSRIVILSYFCYFHARDKYIVVCLQINGQLEFVTYDTKNVIECEGKVTELCRNYPMTPRPAIYNDLWSYDLCEYARQWSR